MLKQLPQVGIAPDEYEFVEETCREVLGGVRHIADDGTAIYFPGGGYEACWTRDFCYMVEGAGHLIPAEETLACIDFLLKGQRDDGAMPDRVRSDGKPVYMAGPEDAPLGDDPPTDNAQFMVKLVCAYVELAGDYAAFLERREQLYDGMEQVPRGKDGLVEVDRNHPHSTYGFTDTIAKTGKVFFSSLLYWEACRRLAELCAQCEYHDEAHDWYEQAELLKRNLDQFYDDEYGLYRAASGDCNQLDIWGSAYACVLRMASRKRAEYLGEFFCSVPEVSIWHGHVRHLPAGEYWERLIREVVPEPDTYQNGAYWAVPSGWVAQVMATYDENAARDLIYDVLDVWRAEDVYECISPYVPPRCEGYAASVTCVLGAVQADTRIVDSGQRTISTHG